MARTSQRFAEALRALEQTRDVEVMAREFDDGAELRRIPQRVTFRGGDGARTFWREYLAVFSRIETEFTSLVDDGDRAVLEWRSRGTLRTGRPIEYEGVSVVEADRDGRIRAFRTYYDPHAVT